MIKFLEVVTALIFMMMVLLLLLSIAAFMVTTYYYDSQLSLNIHSLFTLLHRTES